MNDSKSRESHNEITEKNLNNELLENNNNNNNNELNKIDDSKINSTGNNIHEGESIVEDKTLEGNTKVGLDSKVKEIINKDNNFETSNSEFIKQTPEDKKVVISKANADTNKLAENVDNGKNLITKDKKVIVSKANADTNKLAENVDNGKNLITKDKNLEENEKIILKDKSPVNTPINTPKEISTTIPVKAKTKPVKVPPIEKKPFLEFINDNLIPEIKNEFKLRGKKVNKINIQKTHRPIAEDICWVIYCEINDTCNFWLSFEKDDITSLKSFSLCKNYEKPSIIESFLIDEKKITLKLIISRILQRLNGQKLIGAN